MKRKGSTEDLLSWFKINMENTQNTIIDLNLAIHNLKMSGKDDLNIGHVLRMSETYLKKYLQDQEEECNELLKVVKTAIDKRSKYEDIQPRFDHIFDFLIEVLNEDPAHVNDFVNRLDSDFLKYEAGYEDWRKTKIKKLREQARGKGNQGASIPEQERPPAKIYQLKKR